MAEVIDRARLVRSGPGNESERLELLREHEQAVRAKVADLNADLKVIHGKVVACEKHVRDGAAGGVWAPTPSH
ncbi:hypothetical protein ACFXPY_19795 [Streptomyces sp. NPDC059153]|uniref:hypothetical protein n=1 Tax=Streptomyces sp. NPDC059153 TaxID=3346743 RepID=UPI00368EB978